jgi:type IV secretory pathway component VirB8
MQDLKNFVNKMNENNIPKNEQKILLKHYITIYNIQHNSKINLNKNNIDLLVG